MNTETTPAPKEVIAAARVLAKRHAEACNVNADDVWTFHSEDFIADATAALQGAGYLAASGAPQEAPGAPTPREIAAMEYADHEIMLDQRDLRCPDGDPHDYRPTNEVYRGRLMYFRCRDCGHNSQMPF